ncbi:class I SAM-dependent methyltransferase [Thermosulfurimonas dismutans]|uniref:Methyltransferase type 11 domain-containing protein n=1 Tax=Thermosulfurimonas dismutans TaxID=999894 RepID=A0A179D3D3_9BACT|nr:class I SAM-dependent methyltransferase [Thermosulfurimonas dismutans]OAQ20311.1 hypothetical protein TDIS_1666 [Thermosulfurimonas dismutans]
MPTYRAFFERPSWKYFGLDVEAGNNVDIMVEDPYNWKEIEDGFADVVISGQAFEHIEFPWLTIKEIYRILKPSGLCCLIVPSSGPEHKYPYDCWRFYPDGMKALAKWAGFEVVEVFTDWGLGPWQDTFAVFQKPASREGKKAPFPKFENRRVAETVYLKAFSDRPVNPEYYLRASKLLRERGETEEALRLLKTAVSMFPQHPQLRAETVEVYLEDGKPELALEHVLFLLKFRPFFPHTIRVTSGILEHLKGEDKQLVLDQLPGDPGGLRRMAGIAENTGSYRLAVECWKKLIEKNPSDINAKCMLALSFKGAGELETFKKIFKEVLAFQLREEILNRTTIIQLLINHFGFESYLEIGVERGINFFQIEAPFKYAVDPKFLIPGGYGDLDGCGFFEMTSDEFFENPPPEIKARGIDIVFIDGLHTYEQSLRDVENALRYLKPNGIIVLHDCLPDSPATAAPTLEEAKKRPDFKGTWTGEVYKTVMHLRAARSDLFVAVVDTDWGVGLVKRGTPESSLDLPLEKIRTMKFEEFVRFKDFYLNLKPIGWFFTWLNT